MQAVAQALLDADLTDRTPIAILSGASLDHAVLALAGMLVGPPGAPISPNCTLLSAAPARGSRMPSERGRR